ncbi:MAG: glycosyltransferase family 39 protein [Crocinitomicaceae bacterium]
MDKFYLDLIIAFCLLAGTIFSFRLLFKKKYALALVLTLLTGLVLRTYLSSDPYLHHWDERYHALVAKNMVDHPLTPTLFEAPVLPYDQEDWIGSHVWLSKPPVPLWNMAASIAAFGNSEFALRIPSIILSLLAVFITFLIGKELFSRNIGLIAAFLHAINGLIIECAAGRVSSDHVETCFIVLVELAAYFLILSIRREKARKFIFLAGVFTGLAFLSKWFPALLIFPLWLIAFVFSDRFNWKDLLINGAILVTATAIVVLPWIIQINSFEDDILNRVLFAFSEPIQKHEHPLFYYWHQIMIIFGEFIYIPLLFMGWKVWKNTDRFQLIVLLSWVLIPLIIFTLGGTKRHTYILIAAPAFFLITAYLFDFLHTKLKSMKYKWAGIVVMIGLIALPLRYSIERLKLFQKQAELSVFYQKRENWEGKFDQHDVVVGCPENIELMYYTDVKAAYHLIPSPDKITDLNEQGYNVYLYRHGEFVLQKD